MSSATPAQDIAAVGMLDDPNRRRLYDWVVAQDHPVGRDEAAQAVGLSRALVAFHLDRLVDAGLLEAGYKRLTGRQGPGAGRPARVYWRAARQFSVSLPDRRYERVADVFATALEHVEAARARQSVQEAARDMGRKLALAPAGASGRERLLSVLNGNGYEPVADERGVIRLRNCPFHALVDEHRDLVCGANLAMAEGITEAAVAEADVRPVLDPQPGMCCVAFEPRTGA